MARPLRIEYKGAFYHVTSRGNERKRIFYAKTDYDQFKDYLHQAKEKYGCRFHCYAFMPNHYHLIVETPDANLSKVMQFINGSYTNFLNRKRKRVGHLFQGRYKAILIDVDTYLLELSRYIHLNPVRAGIVDRPEAYGYSSYGSYVSGKDEELVSRELIWAMVSRNRRLARDQYRSFVERGIGQEMGNPLDKVYGGCILGAESFIRQTLERLKGEVLTREEISHRRALRGRYGPQEILELVCEHFGMELEELIRNKGERRGLLVHLLKRKTAMTNREIGELVGGLTYSAVSKVEARFLEKSSKDKALGKAVKELLGKMSNVKG